MTLIEAKEVFNKNAASIINTTAIDLINNAIDLRIDMKPYWRKDEDGNESWACPRCDICVTVDHGRIRETCCSNCGQKLDWSGLPDKK